MVEVVHQAMAIQHFFDNSSLSAEVTGLKKELTDRHSGTMLNCLNQYTALTRRDRRTALATVRQLVKEYNNIGLAV